MGTINNTMNTQTENSITINFEEKNERGRKKENEREKTKRKQEGMNIVKRRYEGKAYYPYLLLGNSFTGSIHRQREGTDASPQFTSSWRLHNWFTHAEFTQCWFTPR